MSHHDSAAPASPPSSQERRASKRVPCGLGLQTRLGTMLFEVVLMNISTTGMFVRASARAPRSSHVMATRLKPGTRVLLRFEVEGQRELHEARGCVAWQCDLGVGVEFFEISPPMRELIARLVDGDGWDASILESVTAATLYQPA